MNSDFSSFVEYGWGKVIKSSLKDEFESSPLHNELP